MMDKMKKLKNAKKGFTLIEMIVVLVIIAILAAIAIPSLTGYIGQAKDKQVLTEAREVYVAAQAVASNKYATGDTTDITDTELNNLIGEDLASTTDSGSNFTITVTDGKVTAFQYKDSNANKSASLDTATNTLKMDQ